MTRSEANDLAREIQHVPEGAVEVIFGIDLDAREEERKMHDHPITCDGCGWKGVPTKLVPMGSIGRLCCPQCSREYARHWMVSAIANVIETSGDGCSCIDSNTLAEAITKTIWDQQ